MKIDETISEKILGRRWRVKFNTRKYWIQLVDLLALAFHKIREAEHVHKDDDRILKRLSHEKSLLLLTRLLFRPSRFLCGRNPCPSLGRHRSALLPGLVL